MSETKFLSLSIGGEEDSTKKRNLIKDRPIIIVLIIFGVILLISLIITFFCFLKLEEEPQEKEKFPSWSEAYQKAEKFISKCNLTERVNLLFGTENMKEISPILNDSTREKEKQYLCVGKIDPFSHKNDFDFKGMCLQDGPAGVRFANGTGISWQASINTAATFNKSLMYQIGKAQGEESKSRGINVLLGPCMNMLRNPQGGRIWEGFGEDPYLAGTAGAYITKGIQSAGVIASVKHYVANDQETYRKASSSNLDMQTLMDIYVEPFYRAIKYGDPGSVMASYNAINNTYVYENKLIITDILRGILNFKGFVVSDWWEVVSDTPETINSGLDMNMPGGYNEGPYDEEHKYDNYGRNHSYWTHLEDFVKEGLVKEERITEAATRIIASMYKLNQMDNYTKIDMYVETKTPERIEIQRQAATESQVLLKNEDGILPITSKVKKIAVIGSDAFPRDCIGEGDLNCINSTNKVYNGHMPLGYGSGTTKFSYLIDPYQAILKLANEAGIEVLDSGKLIYTDDEDGVHISGVEDLENAAIVAGEADIAIVFISADSGEEYISLEGSIGDRANLDVWHNGNDLVDLVATANPNTIVVINSPATVNLPFIDKVKAIIYSGFAGAESGNAIADILFGKANPSGHLPFVWAKLEDYIEDVIELENLTIVDNVTGQTWKDIHRYNGINSKGLEPDYENDKEQYEYKEGLYIGQRYFNKFNKKPIFPFGYGLSYTTFMFSELVVKVDQKGLFANFKIKNVGEVDGMATAMLFITFPDYIGDYPSYLLKGFEKVFVKAHDTKNVQIFADDHALSYFNVKANNYTRVDEGVLKVAISDNGDPTKMKLYQEVLAKY